MSRSRYWPNAWAHDTERSSKLVGHAALGSDVLRVDKVPVIDDEASMFALSFAVGLLNLVVNK